MFEEIALSLRSDIVKYFLLETSLKTSNFSVSITLSFALDVILTVVAMFGTAESVMVPNEVGIVVFSAVVAEDLAVGNNFDVKSIVIIALLVKVVLWDVFLASAEVTIGISVADAVAITCELLVASRLVTVVDFCVITTCWYEVVVTRFSVVADAFVVIVIWFVIAVNELVVVRGLIVVVNGDFVVVNGCAFVKDCDKIVNGCEEINKGFLVIAGCVGVINGWLVVVNGCVVVVVSNCRVVVVNNCVVDVGDIVVVVVVVVALVVVTVAFVVAVVVTGVR